MVARAGCLVIFLLPISGATQRCSFFPTMRRKLLLVRSLFVFLWGAVVVCCCLFPTTPFGRGMQALGKSGQLAPLSARQCRTRSKFLFGRIRLSLKAGATPSVSRASGVGGCGARVARGIREELAGMCCLKSKPCVGSWLELHLCGYKALASQAKPRGGVPNAPSVPPKRSQIRELEQCWPLGAKQRCVWWTAATLLSCRQS